MLNWGPHPKEKKRKREKGPTEYKISDGIYMESREMKRRGKTDNSRNRRRKKKKRFFNRRSCSTARVLLLLLFADEIFTDSSFLIFISPRAFIFVKWNGVTPPKSSSDVHNNSRFFCQLELDSICWADFFFFDCVVRKMLGNGQGRRPSPCRYHGEGALMTQ